VRIPHVTHNEDADVTDLEAFRKRTNEEHVKEGVKVTMVALLMKALVPALKTFPEFNAALRGDELVLRRYYHLGFAADTPHGLVVPVITSCETKTIPQIAAARADLVERTRAGKLMNEDLMNGTFTISNLGMYGVERFTAVLNPPQAGILAVGAIEERPVVVEGDLEIQPRMDLTLTVDHRSVDGATASEFLRTVKSFLEEPGLAL
jgi:pyruvate dehydrogenase E2 component (dihydrolipoamide acetyltransferase)